jgi:GTP:adenosylcobinamide-phosphate guanylyltransferase
MDARDKEMLQMFISNSVDAINVEHVLRQAGLQVIGTDGVGYYLDHIIANVEVIKKLLGINDTEVATIAIRDVIRQIADECRNTNSKVDTLIEREFFTSHFTEVRNSYRADGVTYIDVWKTDFDYEEGETVAKIYDSGIVAYLNHVAVYDIAVRHAIEEVKFGCHSDT